MTCVSCGSDRVVSFGRNTEGWLSGCLRCGASWVEVS